MRRRLSKCEAGSWRHRDAWGTLTGAKRHRDKRHRDAHEDDGPNFMIWDDRVFHDFFVLISTRFGFLRLLPINVGTFLISVTYFENVSGSKLDL